MEGFFVYADFCGPMQDGPSVMHKIAESIVRMHDRPMTFANWLNAIRLPATKPTKCILRSIGFGVSPH